MSGPNILLFGLGAIGSVYLCILDKGGARVTTVCRSNYEAVKENGMHLSSEMLGELHVKPHAVVKSPADAKGPFEYVVVTSKATLGTGIPDLLAPAVGAQTAIVLAQNGIENEQEWRARFPENPIISGSVYTPTTQRRPDYTTHGQFDILEVGLYPASDRDEAHKKLLNDFVAVYNRGGGGGSVHEDVQEKKWAKLLLNGSMNPIAALTYLDSGRLSRASDYAFEGLIGVMAEICAVVNKAGYPAVSLDKARETLQKNTEYHLKTGGVKEPSMLTDVRYGRELEVEAILGNPTRIARQLGVQTPKLDLLYLLIKARNVSLQIERDAKKGEEEGGK